MAQFLRTTSIPRPAPLPGNNLNDFRIANRRDCGNYFFSENAIHSLCRMLSTVAPCASFADLEDAPATLWNAVGKLLAAPYNGELASWLVPYMIRAKLRFDIVPSRRTLGGYL